MRIFLFSDLHCNYKHLANITNFITSNTYCDAVIFAGDVLNMGETVGYCNKFLEAIRKSQKPFFWVPGNNDFGRGYYKILSRYQSLEGKVTTFADLKLTGVGGSPASWSGQYAGEKMIDKKEIGGSIFVSHYPPPLILNWKKEDFALSPTPTKKFSDSPIAHICGHIHYQWGVSYLGQTKVIKLAAAELGYYAIMESDSLQVTFGRFN